MSLVQLDKISKQYGDVFALHDVSLSVEQGEFVAIMGPSGSGKTTMLNVIGCMDKPTRGSVLIDGVDVCKLSGRELTELRRNKIGLVFQQFHLIPHLTAVENVMLAQYYHSLPDKTEALAALERVGLKDRATHFSNQLSGGEQQRVCIARALINYPAIILADEPTGNLDEENEKLVMGLFKELHKEGHTVVLITHDAEIGRRTQRRIRLEHGHVVVKGAAGGDPKVNSGVAETPN
jgi:putative ABC transport system ATP-binding protein